MTHRQPKLPLTLRIIAAVCVVLWVAGVSACNLEALLCCESHGSEALEHSNHQHSHNTQDAAVVTKNPNDENSHHAHTAETHHSHSPHKHENKANSCCSTLTALVQVAKPMVLSAPAYTTLPSYYVLPETHAAPGIPSENPSFRQAEWGDWVFTPQVCLDSAHRSLAPPSLS